jgi:tripeptidyl-peptidase-1
MDRLESILYEVSDPTSAKYGQHLSASEVAQITSNDYATKKVVSYLSTHGIPKITNTTYGEFVIAEASLEKWESLFNEKFNAYTSVHDESKMHVFRAERMSISSHIVDHISAVLNVIDLPIKMNTNIVYTPVESQPNRNSSKSSISTLATSSTGVMTPARFKQVYNVFSNTGNSLASQSIYSTNGQYFSSTDLANFQATYGIPSHPVDFDPDNRNNPTLCSTSIDSCVESTADLEVITAIAQNIPTTIM